MRSRRPWFDCDREAVLMAMFAAGAATPGGDDPNGLHRYLMPRRIGDMEFALFSSCSGMPLLDWVYEACEVPYHYVLEGTDRSDVESRMAEIEVGFQRKLLEALCAPRGTSVVVASSPADAFRMAATLFAIDGNGGAMWWLVPSIAELGSDGATRAVGAARTGSR
jgi:hypothetical protein